MFGASNVFSVFFVLSMDGPEYHTRHIVGEEKRALVTDLRRIQCSFASLLCCPFSVFVDLNFDEMISECTMLYY